MSNVQTPSNLQLESYLNTLMHAVHCRNANCSYSKCIQFKRVMVHSKQCQMYKNSQCDYCRQLLTLCVYHAKACSDEQCQVPFCASIKIKLKQKKQIETEKDETELIDSLIQRCNFQTEFELFLSF